MANYSEELKQHLIDNEHIREVHFDAAGNHHFNVHEFAGKKYSRIATDIHGGLTDEQVSEPFLITETANRIEILGNVGPVIHTTVDEFMDAADSNLPDMPAPNESTDDTPPE